MGKKTLTPSELDLVLQMLRRGDPIHVAAGHFGLTKKDFDELRRADDGVDCEALKAQSDGESMIRRNMVTAIEEGKKTWQGWAMFLRNDFGFIDAIDTAKARSLNAKSADTLDQQKSLRAFVEAARHESEGNPEAKASDDDGYQADREAIGK